jgi:predicted transposase YdaD
MSATTPHDALFKWTFGYPEHAAGELAAVLPAALSARIDWSELTVVSGSFVDEELGDRHADLLFQAPIDGRNTFLYVLFEHQSAPDRWMALRLLRYMVRIWDRHQQAHPEADRLPAIVPLVLYHGEAPWSSPQSLHDLFDLDDETRTMFGDALLGFRYLLDDLGRATDESLLSRPLSPRAQVTLWALKYGRRGMDALAQLRHWHDAIRELLRHEGAWALVVHLRYTLLVNDDVTQSDLQDAIGALGPEANEAIMTVGQQLIEQGRIEGRVEGRVEGRAEGIASVLARMLTRLGVPLTDDQLRRLRGQSPEVLEALAADLIEAGDSDAALAILQHHLDEQA